MNKKQKNIIAIKFYIFTFIILLSAIFLIGTLYFQKINSTEYIAKTNAIAGEVISKTIVVTNDNINIYKIYVDVPYEENGDIKHTSKYFEVPKITFDSFEIGDYFDALGRVENGCSIIN